MGKRASAFPYARALCGYVVLFVGLAIVLGMALMIGVELMQDYRDIGDAYGYKRALYREQCSNAAERNHNPERARICDQLTASIVSIDRFGAYNQALLRFLERHGLCGGLSCVTYFRDSLQYLGLYALAFLACVAVLLYFAYRCIEALIKWDFARNAPMGGILDRPIEGYITGGQPVMHLADKKAV